MSISVERRITNGLFQLRNSGALDVNVAPDEVIDDIVPPETEKISEEEIVESSKPEQESTYESAFE